jgi:hypothetical protein
MGILRTETYNPPATEVFSRTLTPDSGKKFDGIKINDVAQIIPNPLSFLLSIPAGEEEFIVDLCQVDEVVVPAGFTVNIQNSSRVQLRIGSFGATPLPAGQNATLTRQAGQSAEIWLSPIFGANITGINVNGVPETGVNPYEKNVDYGLTISNIQGNITVIVTDDLIANLTHKVTINAGVGGTSNKTGVNIVPHNTNFSFTVTPDSGYQIDQITPSNGSNFTITNPAGQTSSVNGVSASMSINVSFKTAVVVPFYIDIRNNLQIQPNNNVSALQGTVPSARSRRTLVATNSGVRFKMNYSPNHFQLASDYNSIYVGLAQGANVPSTISDIDYLFSLLHRVYNEGGVIISRLYRGADENNYNIPPSPNPANSYLLQTNGFSNGVADIYEFIYATGALYEIFITSTNDVQFKVNGVTIYTSRVKAYPSPSNPFYLDLLMRATDSIGAAGSISDIQLLGTWTS